MSQLFKVVVSSVIFGLGSELGKAVGEEVKKKYDSYRKHSQEATT